MTTNNRSEVHVDAKITAGFGVANALDLDVFAVGSRSLPMACPQCHYVGPFSCGLLCRGERRVTREYECPVCKCTITVTVRV